MAEFAQSAPHVYYPVSELSAVKDVRVMKNTKIKTIGYIFRKNKTVLKDTPNSSTSIVIDLRHIDTDVLEIYPYIIFGILCTVNEEPIISVKFVKRFNSCDADLEMCKEQCLALRDRLRQYDNIPNLAKIYNWA